MQAARRVRTWAGERLARVRSRGWLVVQTALGAALAYALATALPGDEPAYFAPIAAVIALNAARRTRQAVEIVIGGALGLAVADALVLAVGTGTLQLALVVGLAMVAALLLRTSVLFVNQAAVAAILVVTLSPPDGGVPDRLIHALVGGGVGVLLGQVLLPRNPLRTVTQAAEPVLADLARVLESTAASLRDRDVRLARRALEAARGMDDEVDDFEDAVVAGREVVRMSPARRGVRPQVDLYADAALQVDHAVRNTRVLARAAMNAIRQGIEIEPELPEAIDVLAAAVRALGEELAHPADSENETRRLAREAAQRATDVLVRRQDFATSVIVAQVRATATDLARGTGLDSEVARDVLGLQVNRPANVPRDDDGGSSPTS